MSNISYLKKLSKLDREGLLKVANFEEPMLANTVLRYEVYRELAEIKTHEHFYEGDEAWFLTGEVWQVERAFNRVDIRNGKAIIGDRSYVVMTMNDFDIFDHRVGQTLDWHKPTLENTKGLYAFMYKKFGEAYKQDFIKYFNKYSKKTLADMKIKLENQKNKALDVFENMEKNI